MMMNPEAFYNKRLVGKEASQILTTIRGLKNKFGKPKKKLESPNHLEVPIDRAALEEEIRYTRRCIEMAKKAYGEAGGEYQLSRVEKRADDFIQNIPNIKKMTLSVGDYRYQKWEVFHTVMVSAAGAFVSSFCLAEGHLETMEQDVHYTRKEFFNRIEGLHLGEWRKNYCCVQYGFCNENRAQWKLLVEYNNGKEPFSSHGYDILPYNFSGLFALLGDDSAVAKKSLALFERVGLDAKNPMGYWVDVNGSFFEQCNSPYEMEAAMVKAMWKEVLGYCPIDNYFEPIDWAGEQKDNLVYISDY